MVTSYKTGEGYVSYDIVKKPDGTIGTYDARWPKGNRMVEVTTGAREHIEERHFGDKVQGSKFDGIWEDLKPSLESAVPETFSFTDGEMKITPTVAETIGSVGIMRLDTMVERGLVRAEDLTELDLMEQAVFAANVYGDTDEKLRIVDLWNDAHADSALRLVARGPEDDFSVVPAVVTEMQPTKEFTIVFHGSDGDPYVQVHSAWPGPDMPKLPSDPIYRGVAERPGTDVKLSVAEAWERLCSEEGTEQERLDLARYVNQVLESHEAWWQTGFIDKPTA